MQPLPPPRSPRLRPGLRLRAALSFASLVAPLVSAQTAAAETFAVDTAASRVRVHLDRAGIVKFLGHAHEIEAPLLDGRVEVVEGEPARSSVRLRFDSRRLAIVAGTEPAGDVAAVEERMRGPEVLDVARHPLITFESTEVGLSGTDPDGGLRLQVRGRLALKGRREELRMPVVVKASQRELSAAGEVWLELRALGIEPPSVGGVVKVANRFRLALEVHAVLAPASR